MRLLRHACRKVVSILRSYGGDSLLDLWLVTGFVISRSIAWIVVLL